MLDRETFSKLLGQEGILFTTHGRVVPVFSFSSGVQLLGCTSAPVHPPSRGGFPKGCICSLGGAGGPRRYEERIAKRRQKSRRKLDVLRSRRDKEGTEDGKKPLVGSRDERGRHNCSVGTKTHS